MQRKYLWSRQEYCILGESLQNEDKKRVLTWVLHELEAFIGKASKGDVVVLYFKPLATQHMKASGSPAG